MSSAAASTGPGALGYTPLEVEVILRQLLHSDPVAISYLLGSSGQACGAVVESTIAFKKRRKVAFRIAEVEALVASVLADVPP